MPEEVTKIVFIRGKKEVSVQLPGTNLDYTEFMELVETMVSYSGYPKYQIEDYIKQWAKDIISSTEN